MALAHFWMKTLSRATPNLPASVAVHYLKREAEFAPEAYLSRTSDSTKDRADLRDQDVQHLPSWAKNSPGKFFSAAEQYEGANRYHAVMLQFSLPREMTHEQHIALTKDFIAATMPDKPLLWVKHEPLDKYTHEPQPHIHILMSARTVDGIERSEAQTFQRWNASDPSTGGCRKDLFWSRRQAVEQLRMAFTDITNMHAEQLGLDVRIDSRSLRRRDIDRVPMYKEEDRPSREALAAEQIRAAVAWEQRKAYKGIDDIHAMPREEFVLHVRQWTRGYEPGTALPTSSPEVVAAYNAREAQRAQELEQDIARLALYTTTLRLEHGLEVRAAQRHARAMASHERMDRLIAQGQALGIETESMPTPQHAPREQPVSRRARRAGITHEEDMQGGAQGPKLHEKRRDEWEW